jgi:hypothetical protein
VRMTKNRTNRGKAHPMKLVCACQHIARVHELFNGERERFARRCARSAAPVRCSAVSTELNAFVMSRVQGAVAARGLAAAMRTDNGVSFAFPWALYILRKFVGVVVRLGILRSEVRSAVRNKTPARTYAPDLEDGRTRPAARNVLQQQARFDEFVQQ